MKNRTIQDWVDWYLSKYESKEAMNVDLIRIIADLKQDGESPNQLKFYKRIKNKLNKNLVVSI